MKANLGTVHLFRKLRRDLLSISPRGLALYLRTLVRVWRISGGEFYVPAKGREDWQLYSDLQNIIHLARYEWASRVLSDRDVHSVLDIACGAGYGSFLLSKSVPVVHGADGNARAVRYASAVYSRPNIRFSCCGIQDLCEMERGPFDAIACFDTVEHIEEGSWVEPMARCLKPGGILLLNTPLSPVTADSPSNPHHRVEYSYGDLCRLLERIGETRSGAELPRREFLLEVEKHAGRALFGQSPLACVKT